MQKARMMGNRLRQLAEKNKVPVSELSALLGCSEVQVKSLFAGRSFASFEQISTLANRFHVSIADILAGDTEHYNQTVAHCMNQFGNTENRERILDIIDDYMDILDAIN